MSRGLRVAIIGAGLIGQEHINYVRHSAEAEFIAIADPADGSRDVATAAGAAHYDDYEDLLNDERPDGVIVATPNSLHAPVSIAAIERGVPVLVEKPIAGDLHDAERIMQTAETHDVPVLVGHQRRYAPDIVAARRFIASGGIGTAVAANLMNTWRKHDEYFHVDWRTRKGGGPVLINLIHDIDAARYLIGEIDAVSAIRSSAMRELDVPDTVGAILTFTGGAIGTAISTDAAVSPWCWDLTSGYGAYFPAPPSQDTYFISGTEAAIALPSLTVFRHDDGNHWQLPVTTSTLARHDVNPYAAQLAHFVNVARGDANPVISAEDAYRTLAAAIAIDNAPDPRSRAQAPDSI